MPVSDKTLRREAVLNSCGYRLEWIKHGTYKKFRDFPVFELWRVLFDLYSVHAEPKDIGSSDQEFDAILIANGC